MTSPPRRFYQQAATQPADGGHALVLDDRPALTPARRALILPAAALAEAVAAEWQAAGETIDFAAMPLTQLAHTVIDGVAERRIETARSAAAYGRSDLLCYRADEPPELAARQEAVWQPLLDWAALHLGAPLSVTAGLVAIDQPSEALERLDGAILALDPWRLTGLHLATAVSGSLVIALALLAGRLSATEAFAAAQVDETWQVERWGIDAEAERRRQRIAAELAAAERFVRLLDQG